ncbi:MAG TPA: Fe3+/spermidine/putrescine ABC transporter ATP-binding protein [Dehalococcoidia bacterium]|nr:Fe3+/spermidine/putrescine ABC transporter ATP-binding protein [Chloroflexota bacterium]HCP24493.1 Fe3+/spermidine/putrescine ABC transporter ATP-binding protein [Dehalococcoidia bacterium]
MDLERTGTAAKGWVQTRVGDFLLDTEWEIAPGEVLVLFGPSGAGKSSTLRSIAGLLRPLQGHIEVGGTIVYDHAAGTWVPTHQRRLGYLTQQYNLFPHLSVAENIAFGLESLGTPEREARVSELSRLFHLGGLDDRYPWELSGGQQQRVALARALAPRPEMLLLDEPFASLDSELRRTLRRELRSMLARSPVPVMLVTHDREEALALGDSVQVINEGRTLVKGEPLEVLGQPGAGRVARLVGVENLFPLTVQERNPRDGTMTCTGQGLRLEVPLDAHLSGGDPVDGEQDRVTIGIRASDIILAAEELRGSSARNRLEGRVTAIEPRPPGYTVTLDCGQPLRCHITGAAMEEMVIVEGQRLWAVFKASSCFLVDEPPPTSVADDG